MGEIDAPILRNSFICSKASNPCDIVVEWPGGQKSVYHCFSSLHQPSSLASKRRLRVRKGDSKESTLPSLFLSKSDQHGLFKANPSIKYSDTY
jgi:hypothetical protein